MEASAEHPARLNYCHGKVAFSTASGAHDARRVMLNRRKFKVERGCRLEVYRCRRCHAWHIGNNQQ